LISVFTAAKHSRVFSAVAAVLILYCAVCPAEQAPAVLLPGDMDRISPLLAKYADWRLLILADEREEAALMLAKLKEASRPLELKLLAYALRGEGKHLEATYFLLGLSGGERARKFLKERLDKGALRERLAAVRGLMAGEPGFFASLEALAESKSAQDRRVAAAGFARAGQRAIDPLVKLAADADQTVRLAAVMSLGEVGTERGETKLRELLDAAKDPIDRIMLLRAISLATHIETDQSEMRASVLAQSQLGAIQEQSTIVAELLKEGKGALAATKRGQAFLLQTMDELILRLETKIDESMGMMTAAADAGQLSPEAMQAMAAQAQMRAMQAALLPSQGSQALRFSRDRPADFAAADLKLKPLARSVDWGKLPGVDPQKVANALNSQKLPERYKRVLKAYYRALAETERKNTK